MLNRPPVLGRWFRFGVGITLKFAVSRINKGDRKGQWSIRINDQWRVCFRFEKGDAFDVEIIDYH